MAFKEDEDFTKEENRKGRGVEHAANGPGGLGHSSSRKVRMEAPCRASGWEV